MTRTSRLLAMAALLNLTAGATLAAAQTVYVRNAKPGETIEVVVNGATAATGKADQAGEAKLPISIAQANTTELDANVYLDSCDAARRVILVRRSTAPPPVEPGGNCSRSDIQGVFWIRSVSTVVVNFAADANPSLLLVKGEYTPRDVERAESGGGPKRLAPNGLALYGGAAYTNMSDLASLECGNVGNCKGVGSGLGFTVGGEFWFNRFLGFDAAYLRPKAVTSSGSDTGYKFNTTTKTDVVTLMGKFGGTGGIVRAYGQGGVNFAQSTTDTSETIDPVTITVEDTPVTIPNGTQTWEVKNQGWNYVFGGGLEVWVTKSFAIYGEANYAHIKGDLQGTFVGIGGSLSNSMTYFTVGARVHVGGSSSTTK